MKFSFDSSKIDLSNSTSAMYKLFLISMSMHLIGATSTTTPHFSFNFIWMKLKKCKWIKKKFLTCISLVLIINLGKNIENVIHHRKIWKLRENIEYSTVFIMLDFLSSFYYIPLLLHEILGMIEWILLHYTKLHATEQIKPNQSWLKNTTENQA